MGVRLSELRLGPVPTNIKSATFAIGNFSNCNRCLRSLLSWTKKQNTNYDGYNLAEAKMNLNSLCSRKNWMTLEENDRINHIESKDL